MAKLSTVEKIRSTKEKIAEAREQAKRGRQKDPSHSEEPKKKDGRGRKKGSFTISAEKQQRLQLAKRRRTLGYTRRLEIAREMAMKKIEEQFKEWGIFPEEELEFSVDAFDWENEPWLKSKGRRVAKIVGRAIEYLKMGLVSAIGIDTNDKRVLAETDGTGWLVFIWKRGKEYLVQTNDEWNMNCSIRGTKEDEEEVIEKDQKKDQ